MSRPPVQRHQPDDARLVYEEYELGAGFRATIYDPEDGGRWLRSDTAVPIRD